MSCFIDIETPIRWKKLTIYYPQACRPKTGWTQKADDVDSWLPHYQPIQRMPQADHIAYHHPLCPILILKTLSWKPSSNSSLLNTNYLDSLLGTLATISATLSLTTTWYQQIGFTVYGQGTHLWIRNTPSVRCEWKEASHWLNRGQPLVWGTCGLPWTHQVTQKFMFSQLCRWCTRHSTWLQGSTCHSSQGSRLQLVVCGGGRPARNRQWNGLKLRWSRLSTHWISRIWKPPLQFLEHCMENERKGDTWVLGIRLSMPRYPGVSQRITKFPASSSQLLERLVTCLSLHTEERRVTLAAPQGGAPCVRKCRWEV